MVAERKCNCGGKEREEKEDGKKKKGKKSFYCSRRFYSLSELSLGAQKLKSAELGGFCVW